MADSTAGGVPTFDGGDPDVYTRQVLARAARLRARRLVIEDGRPTRAAVVPAANEEVPTVGP